MTRMVWAVVIALLAAPAAAQPEGPRTKQEGEYGGVNPEAPPAPPDPGARHRPRKPPPKKTLTWIGFVDRPGGGAELFFQAATPFTLGQHVEGKTLVIFLDGLTRQAHNTRRALDTRFFDSPIARVKARAVGAVKGRKARKGHPARAGHPAGVEVRVTFKDPRNVAAGAVRSEQGKDGMHYVYVGFGSGGAGTGGAGGGVEPDLD